MDMKDDFERLVTKTITAKYIPKEFFDEFQEDAKKNFNGRYGQKIMFDHAFRQGYEYSTLIQRIKELEEQTNEPERKLPTFGRKE